MSLLHVVAFRFREGTSDADVAALREALDALPAQVPELLAYRHGPDLRLREGNADYAVVAEVAGPAELAAYLEHPEHQRALRERIQPLLAERHAVQLEA